MAKVLVVGSINMDLVVRVPHSPRPGETVLGGDFETFPGGKGANQAVAASRMGGEVTMVGRVGSDNFGDTLIQGLVEDNIRTTYVIKDTGTPTGIAMIAVAANGENMIVVASGANYKVSEEDVTNARDIMRDTDLLLLQLECPMEAVAAAIDLAKAYDIPVVLNPAPAQPLSQALLANVDILTPNETELMMLAGEDTVDKAVKKVLSWGTKNLVVTLGANGARVITEGVDRHIPAHEITAVDTTAAGDAFNGALAVAYAEGKSLLDAVDYGMAAGALAATRRGAQPSLPTRDAVENLIKSSHV
ncbi:MAG: ribokinase [Anaerolineaceae bacterium]|nr:ribokinase [Anaerolineaceae bacterium]